MEARGREPRGTLSNEQQQHEQQKKNLEAGHEAGCRKPGSNAFLPFAFS